MDIIEYAAEITNKYFGNTEQVDNETWSYFYNDFVKNMPNFDEDCDDYSETYYFVSAVRAILFANGKITHFEQNLNEMHEKIIDFVLPYDASILLNFSASVRENPKYRNYAMQIIENKRLRFFDFEYLQEDKEAKALYDGLTSSSPKTWHYKCPNTKTSPKHLKQD